MNEALIVGAGIAGDTLAVLLGRLGWKVTVVEIAAALRTGGQTVDLRGDSRDVLDEMGLLDTALACLVPQRGAAWIDARGERLATMPVEALGGNGLVSSEELLRTDLARILHDAAPTTVEHRFGDTVEQITATPEGAHVRFRSGKTGDFDLVVGADGAHSRVRALTFGPEERFRRPLGLAHAWFTLQEQPQTPRLDGWFLIHNAPGSRAVEARPGHPCEQEIGFTFPDVDLPDRHDRAGQLARLEKEFTDVGWRSREFLDAASSAPDFSLDTYDQVHLDSWSRGRVVLLGDSAWCASPLSGLGTALGLRGAAELASALASTHVSDNGDAFSQAFTAYEQRMRPRVKAAQKLPPGRVGMAAPRTARGIRMNAFAMRAVQAPLVRSLATRLASERGRA